LHIIYKKKTIPEHQANLENDFKEIEMLAISYKQNKMYQDWVEQLRKTMYWEVKK